MSWLLIPFCDLGNGRNKESVEHIRSAVQDITEEMGFFSPKSFNFEEKKNLSVISRKVSRKCG